MNILSIQSHVAYGHVGNASATFPMQRLGVDVWPIHTVQFSNHTGYGNWKGRVFDGGMIDELTGDDFANRRRFMLNTATPKRNRKRPDERWPRRRLFLLQKVKTGHQVAIIRNMVGEQRSQPFDIITPVAV